MFSFGWRHAGLLTIWAGKWAIHFFPRPRSWKVWTWPKDKVHYAYGLDEWGFGPFLLVVRGSGL